MEVDTSNSIFVISRNDVLYTAQTLYQKGLIAKFLGLYYNIDNDRYYTLADAKQYQKKNGKSADEEGTMVDITQIEEIFDLPYILTINDDRFVEVLDKLNELQSNVPETLFAYRNAARAFSVDDSEERSLMLKKFNLTATSTAGQNFEAVVKLEYAPEGDFDDNNRPSLITSDEARELINPEELQEIWTQYRQPGIKATEKYKFVDGVWWFSDISPFSVRAALLYKGEQFKSRLNIVTKASLWFIEKLSEIRAVGEKYNETIETINNRFQKVKQVPSRNPTLKPKTGSLVMKDKEEAEEEPRQTSSGARNTKTPSNSRPPSSAKQTSTKQTSSGRPREELSKEEKRREEQLKSLESAAVQKVEEHLMGLLKKGNGRVKLLRNIQQAVYVNTNKGPSHFYEIAKAKGAPQAFNLTTGNNANIGPAQNKKIYKTIDAEFITGSKNTTINLVLDTKDLPVEYVDVSGQNKSARELSAQRTSFISNRVIEQAFIKFYANSQFGLFQRHDELEDNSVSERMDMLEDVDSKNTTEDEETNTSFGAIPVRTRTIGFLPEMLLALPQLYETNNQDADLPEIGQQIVAGKVKKLESNGKVDGLQVTIKNLNSLRAKCGTPKSTIDKLRKNKHLEVVKAELNEDEGEEEHSFILLPVSKDDTRQLLNVDLRGEAKENFIPEEEQQSESESED